MGDLRQSKEWAKYLVSQGWEVEELQVADRKLRIFIKKLPLIGSVIKIQRPDAIPPVEVVDRLAKKHKAIFVRLEPLTINHKPLTGFVPDPAPCLPAKTIVVDLDKPEGEIWKNLSENARRNIKKANGEQLTANSYRGNDEKFNEALKEFHHLLKATGRARGFWPPTFGELKAKADAFGPNAILFLSYPKLQTLSPKPLAGVLLLLCDTTAYSERSEEAGSRRRRGSYYEYAAASDLGRKLNAPYLLVWEAIKAVSREPFAVSRLDFTSIYDPRFHKATKKWKGFTEFKRRWGGQEVEYPQPLIKCYRPLGKLFHRLDKLQFG